MFRLTSAVLVISQNSTLLDRKYKSTYSTQWLCTAGTVVAKKDLQAQDYPANHGEDSYSEQVSTDTSVFVYG